MASFDVDLEKINSKFRQHDHFLQILDRQLAEKPKPQPEAAKESSKSKPGSGLATPTLAPKSSATRNAGSLGSQQSPQEEPEASSSAAEEQVWTVPVAEMPNPRVFGYRDPLEGSPIQYMNRALEAGDSPLYRKMDLKDSQASSTEEADEPQSSGVGSEYKRELFREQVLQKAEEAEPPQEQEQKQEQPAYKSSESSLAAQSHKEGKEESAGTIPEVHLLGQQLRPKQLRSEGNVSAGSSYRALASSGRRERVQRKLSPIKVENLVNLPVKPVTAEVIHSVAEILGYTELHPEVVEKIVDISIRVDAQDKQMLEFEEIVGNVKGFTMDEVKKLIEMKKDETVSEIKETMHYVKMIQEETSSVKHQLASISEQQERQRRFLREAVMEHVQMVSTDLKQQIQTLS